jgi:uncharacterized protein (TIGR00251 family)
MSLKKIIINPRSTKNEIADTLPDGRLKIKLTAAPTDGEANSALIEFLSKEWNIPKSKLKIKSGLTSRTKLIEIMD